MNTCEIDEVEINEIKRLVKGLKNRAHILANWADEMADRLENPQRLRDKAEIRAAQDATPSGRTARSDGTD